MAEEKTIKSTEENPAAENSAAAVFEDEYESVKKSVLQQFSASNPNIQIATGDANTLQAQYDEAKKSGNAALMARIIRQASNNNIQIKQ